MIYFFRFLIVFLFLILLYTVYRSEIIWEGSRRDFYFFYYIGTLLIIVFSIIINYLNLKIQQYVIIIFCSIVFALYFFEFFLLKYDQPKNLDINYDRRTKLEIYEDLKKKNKSIVMSVPPVNQFNTSLYNEFFFLSGVSKAKTIFCNENGYYSIYQSDRYGFNNPDSEWDSKELEYLLVGDSMVQGACVNRPDDVASQLRLLSKKSVLNLGMMGNGPLIEYATLREYIPPKVKKVLWVYYEGNDLYDLKRVETRSKLLNLYLKNLNFSQNLKFKQNKVNNLNVSLIKKEKETEKPIIIDNLINFIKLNRSRTLLLPYQPSPPPELKVIIKLANDLAKYNNGKLYFVYLPSMERYKFFLFKDQKQRVKQMVSDLNIKFIDIDSEVFKKEKNPLKLFPLEAFPHYNVEGYKKVALKIYEKTK